MNFDLSKVRYSKADRLKKIIIPTRLTKDLAEDLGIHIGDGSLYLSGKFRSSPEFHYSSNASEKEYVFHILKLKKKIYNLTKIREYSNRKKTEIGFRFSSLAIATFYTNVIGIPMGKKSTSVDIPLIIKNSTDKKILAGFARGIFDTDFSLTFKNKSGKGHTYPVLHAGFASEKLVISLVEIFTKLGFKVCHTSRVKYFDKRTNKVYIKDYIDISGKKALIKYANNIGFNNPKNQLKYLTWKKLGYCEPHLSLIK